MAFKLIESAQHRWRAVNAPHLGALVRASTQFEAGKLVERYSRRPLDATGDRSDIRLQFHAVELATVDRFTTGRHADPGVG
jgi:predicted transposase YdaD